VLYSPDTQQVTNMCIYNSMQRDMQIIFNMLFSKQHFEKTRRFFVVSLHS